MSTSLYWNPLPKQPEQRSLGSLKHTLAKKLWDADDGSSGQPPIVVGSELIPFLDGIIEGNGSGDMARDAQKLKTAIEKHGKVELSIQS